VFKKYEFYENNCIILVLLTDTMYGLTNNIQEDIGWNVLTTELMSSYCIYSNWQDEVDDYLVKVMIKYYG
jgi:hypothetical protein